MLGTRHEGASVQMSGTRLRAAWRGFALRLVAAMLLVSVPLMVILAYLLTSATTTSLTSAAEQRSVAVARSVTLHLEDWISERREHLQLIAAQAPAELGTPRIGSLLTGVQDAYDDYDLVEITDVKGRVQASSRPGRRLSVAGQSWFAAASSGKPVLTSLVRRGDHLQWILTQPIVGANGQAEGVVVADLNVVELAHLLNPELSNGVEVTAVDARRSLVYDTQMGKVSDDAGLISAGVMGGAINNRATTQAAKTGEPGVARFTDRSGRDVIGGYDILDQCGGQGVSGCLGWTITVSEPAATVLGPAHDQRRRAVLFVALATLAAVAASMALAAGTTRPIRRLTQASKRAAGGDLSVRNRPSGPIELTELGESFNAMLDTSESLVAQVTMAGTDVSTAAAELSASSDELAATTTQQSAAVTQATSTTEELARASAAIADTADEVAGQAAETRENLEQAEADIRLSSERTLALAHKVNDIDALLDLINDIADQTNLLALNAAIEAARAGENGLGFAVVADEVRRLAERSKGSAGEINTIIRAVQGETNATVMAMETGSKQMQRGLTLLEAVTDANAQVRMTTQQQRIATSQVVETMEQLTDSSRQISATADQIASAAGDLADLAGNLEATARTATTADTADQARVGAPVGAAAGDGRG
jgi:methyl-accepting chemotaxis protein